MKRNQLFLVMIILFLLNSVFIFSTEQNDAQKLEKIEKINNNVNIVYWILLGIFFMTAAVTLVMAFTHFTKKEMLSASIVALFLFLLVLLYQMLR